jgi:hypothetical protein
MVWLQLDIKMQKRLKKFNSLSFLENNGFQNFAKIDNNPLN